MARRWRKTGHEVYSTGTREAGAVVWPWTEYGWRVQCWAPGKRLTTFRTPRPLFTAQKVAETWLASKVTRRYVYARD
jgi:hypothetical protein